MMKALLVRRWRSLALRGAVALLFGLAASLWPEMRLAALVLLFGVYAVLDGVVACSLGAAHPARERTWGLLFEGLAGVGLGLAAFFWTRTAAELVVLLIAIWAIGTGVIEVFAAVRLRSELPGELLLLIGGGASIMLGFAIFLSPSARSPALVAMLGSYALVFGAVTFVQALRLRTLVLGRGVRSLRAARPHR